MAKRRFKKCSNKSFCFSDILAPLTTTFLQLHCKMKYEIFLSNGQMCLTARMSVDLYGQRGLAEVVSGNMNGHAICQPFNSPPPDGPKPAYRRQPRPATAQITPLWSISWINTTREKGFFFFFAFLYSVLQLGISNDLISLVVSSTKTQWSTQPAGHPVCAGNSVQQCPISTLALEGWEGASLQGASLQGLTSEGSQDTERFLKKDSVNLSGAKAVSLSKAIRQRTLDVSAVDTQHSHRGPMKAWQRQ